MKNKIILIIVLLVLVILIRTLGFANYLTFENLSNHKAILHSFMYFLTILVLSGFFKSFLKSFGRGGESNEILKNQ